MKENTKLTKKNASNRLYTLGEEIANSITHGFGAALSVAGLTLLVFLASNNGDVYQVVSFSIYGASLVILYLASTLYHSFQNPKVKRVFKIIDHSSIFLLIAGTYTPFLLVGLQNKFGWILFAVIWGLAALGIGFKAFFIDRFQKLSTLAYVLMGWLSVLMINGLSENIEIGGLIWLAVGGAAYTLGVIFYALKKVPYMHSVWHIFVLAGSICHFFSVYLYLAPSA
ncbi:MAG: hemolysin III family protein [Chloroflexi bacterium]|nr:hemolysin III family protein [Chloroflexota bacterium]MBT3668918.1 hemolysin III family protein [Chloroflexota bacterium]MBT4001875.1 hemolysin III family protein [Chloroflexota bacterium]MBT4305355.1 hemolysin III family protein [Chloroflexota bacterium]MBT4532501.1 hemolysin III family protein [Chloroflexota bacterium]